MLMGTEEASVQSVNTQIFEETSTMKMGFQKREQSQLAGAASQSSILGLCFDYGLERWR